MQIAIGIAEIGLLWKLLSLEFFLYHVFDQDEQMILYY